MIRKGEPVRHGQAHRFQKQRKCMCRNNYQGISSRTCVCLLPSRGLYSDMPPISAFSIFSGATPLRISSCAMYSALALPRRSLISSVPVILSAAPVTVTDKLCRVITRASASRLIPCDGSVRFVVPNSKKK